MGKEKYQKEIEDLFNKSAVVDAASIRRVIKTKKRVKQYNKQLIRNLILKGKIKPLVKGYYTIHEDPSLAVFCFSPAYLGLEDAMSFHNLWEQETIPVIITSRKVRQGIRKVLGMNVLVRRINKKYVFGFEYVKSGSFYFPYSDVEKTFVDLIYFRKRLSEENLSNILKRINRKKLHSYLRAYPKRIKNKVLHILES